MKKQQKIVIVDYGMGNTWSVISAIKHLGYSCNLTSNSNKILNADSIILPGVGSFNKAINRLKDTGTFETIREAVLEKNKKILGICLGFQLMGISSTEDGFNKGLNLIPSKVSHFSLKKTKNCKIPHIGFNYVEFDPRDKFFLNISQNSDFYFVHSYRFKFDNLIGLKAKTFYGETFLAAYHSDNIFGTQFHPEKSQKNGLSLIKNFLDL